MDERAPDVLEPLLTDVLMHFRVNFANSLHLYQNSKNCVERRVIDDSVRQRMLQPSHRNLAELLTEAGHFPSKPIDELLQIFPVIPLMRQKRKISQLRHKPAD